jgi:hypothetical protein
MEHLEPYKPDEPATRIDFPSTVVRNRYDVDAVFSAGVNAELSKRNAAKAGQFNPFNEPILNG